MQPNSDVMFIVTYDSGHEEWFWIDAQAIRGGDQMVGAMVLARSVDDPQLSREILATVSNNLV